VLAALRSARRAKETYDLLFIDPPYERARRPDSDRWGRELSTLLAPLLGRGARIVVESDRRAPLALAVEVERQKRYGDTSITIHRQQ
jgi:16S rRNA G966 N2-methylase RsmD